MPLTADRDLVRVLADTRRIALVGASGRVDRPSHRVMGYLLAEGYRVYPVNPGFAGQELQGCRVYPSLAAIPDPIDMVDVFRQPRYLQGIVDEARAIGAAFIWTQLGVVDGGAAASAEQAGIEVVMDRCPAIEIPRLRAAGLLWPAQSV